MGGGKSVVCGGGGFLGGHLVKDLLALGRNVVAVDIKPLDEWYQVHEAADNWSSYDLSFYGLALQILEEAEFVYNLAANMGGVGFITEEHAACISNVRPTLNVAEACAKQGVSKLFWSGSACCYPEYRQLSTDDPALKESDAWPAQPDLQYGLEKLFGEEICKAFRIDFGLQTRVARLHNIYGPNGTYKGGKEKAPAAISKKVIEAKLSGNNEIEIWGDGQQTRSFCWVGDCIDGIHLITNGDYADPINLGSSELVTINQLVDIVEDIAQVKLKRTYNLSAPQGVRGRNSDNTLIKSLYDWEPSTPLREGMEKTYAWIYDQMKD